MIVLRAVLALSCCLAAYPASARAPRYVPDIELAASPLIVVGRWRALVEGAKPATDRYHTAGPGYLTVERVVIGDVLPGEYRLVTGPDSFWDSAGKPTLPQTEYFTQLEVDDTTQPNLWFVSPSKRLAGHENEPTLRTVTGRAVQHLSLEQFYLVLRDPDRDERIAESFHSRDSLTLLRAMRFVMGDKQPWPYDTAALDFLGEYRISARKRLPIHAQLVAGLIGQPDVKVRRAATATYAALAGKATVATMRSLLTNADPETRLIAVGVLAKWRDMESVPRLADAVRGYSEPALGCAAIERLKSWPTDAVVPALITFLENDRHAGQYGDYFYIPAIQARKALSQITGFTFSISVSQSEHAWRAVSRITSPVMRRRKLVSILGEWANPLSAEVFNTGGPARILIRNQCARSVTITRRPPSIDMTLSMAGRYSGGSYGWPPRELKPADYIVLTPGQAVTIGLAEQYTPDYAYGPVSCHRIVLTYTSMGKSFGKRAWIGHVNVHFGGGWKQRPDKLVEVHEKWPNGKPKVSGQTLNDQDCGKWKFFDQSGKLIRTEEHLKNGSTAIWEPGLAPR